MARRLQAKQLSAVPACAEFGEVTSQPHSKPQMKRDAKLSKRRRIGMCFRSRSRTCRLLSALWCISIVFCSAFQFSCSDSEHDYLRRDADEKLDSREQIQQFPLNGEIYITTKGGDVVQMAGASVYAIDDQTLNTLFLQLIETFVPERHAINRKEYLESLRLEITSKESVLKIDHLLIEIMEIENSIASCVSSIELLQANRKDVNAIREELLRLRQDAEKESDQYLPDAPKSISPVEIFDLLHALCARLPVPVARADSLGKFEVFVEKRSPYWLVAKSDRYVGKAGKYTVSDTEEYRWLVPATPGSGGNDLINGNLDFFSQKIEMILPQNVISEEEKATVIEEGRLEGSGRIGAMVEQVAEIKSKLRQEKDRRDWLLKYGKENGADVSYTPGKPEEIEQIRNLAFRIQSSSWGAKEWSDFEGTRFFLFDNQGFNPMWGVITLDNYRTDGTWKVYPTGVLARFGNADTGFGLTFGAPKGPSEIELVSDLTIGEYLKNIDEYTRDNVYPICAGDPTIALLLRFWLLDHL